MRAAVRTPGGRAEPVGRAEPPAGLSQDRGNGAGAGGSALLLSVLGTVAGWPWNHHSGKWRLVSRELLLCYRGNCSPWASVFSSVQ